jgi:hypothetical protein
VLTARGARHHGRKYIQAANAAQRGEFCKVFQGN